MAQIPQDVLDKLQAAEDAIDVVQAKQTAVSTAMQALHVAESDEDKAKTDLAAVSLDANQKASDAITAVKAALGIG